MPCFMLISICLVPTLTHNQVDTSQDSTQQQQHHETSTQDPPHRLTKRLFNRRRKSNSDFLNTPPFPSQWALQIPYMHHLLALPPTHTHMYTPLVHPTLEGMHIPMGRASLSRDETKKPLRPCTYSNDACMHICNRFGVFCTTHTGCDVAFSCWPHSGVFTPWAAVF